MPDKGITLILGGIGVKGVANIGALQSVREHKIMVKRIIASGTSSLVAAQFALGGDLDSLTNYFARFFNKNKWHLWGLEQLGGLQAHRTKRNFSYFLRGVAFTKDNINKISALSWDSVEGYFNEVFGKKKNSDLQIPLAISCIDLNMGKEVLVQNEDLLDSLKASIAFPGLFPPVSIGGHEMVSSSLYCEWPFWGLKEAWRPFVVIDIPSVLTTDKPSSAVEILADIDRMRRAVIKDKLLHRADRIIHLESLKHRWESYDQIPKLVSIAYRNMNERLDSLFHL